MGNLIARLMREQDRPATAPRPDRWAATVAVLIQNHTDTELDTLAAYERCEEFRDYLTAYLDWQSVHAAYSAAPSEASRNALLAATHYKEALLEMARKTPEHRAAFGY